MVQCLTSQRCGVPGTDIAQNRALSVLYLLLELASQTFPCGDSLCAVAYVYTDYSNPNSAWRVSVFKGRSIA